MSHAKPPHKTDANVDQCLSEVPSLHAWLEVGLLKTRMKHAQSIHVHSGHRRQLALIYHSTM